jgi:hypothetical protein
VPTRQGIDGCVRVYSLPLYIKVIEFIDRDYKYRVLAREITASTGSDKEKALAVFGWVRKNIKTDIPKSWPIYDDHILNIIIRGYGVSDQLNDVFTALCAYAGLPAGWARIEIPAQRKQLILSFVKIGRRWCVFDAFRGVYFLNDNGDIASLDDIRAGRYDKTASAKRLDGSALTYEDYFRNISVNIDDITRRPIEQMPFRRLFREARRLFSKNGGAS